MDPQQQPFNPNQLPQATPQAPVPQNNVYGPALPPLSPNPLATPQPTGPMGGPTPPKKSSKRLYIIGGAVGGVIIIIIVAVVVLSGGNKKKPQQQQQQQQSTEAQGPQPAKAVDVEQANNSISQDISSLNDDKDFQADKFDDKTIGL